MLDEALDRLDANTNTASAIRMSTVANPNSAWVVPTNEERTIARHVIERVGATGA